MTREIVAQLLPVIDDFDILFTHSKDDSTDNVSLDGIKMIYNKLLDTLGEMGLEPIEAENETFNPAYHEAVLTEESDKEEGTILKVWQKGFTFRDSLLRPAKVVTAKEKEAENDSDE
ncbi:MAG: nucleotide exchange factor GrpE [candidate division KSB1 bacterium]|nr:nucleotide exchange factor GrpE [candidate division KSB1 bacterium]